MKYSEFILNFDCGGPKCRTLGKRGQSKAHNVLLSVSEALYGSWTARAGWSKPIRAHSRLFKGQLLFWLLKILKSFVPNTNLQQSCLVLRRRGASRKVHERSDIVVSMHGRIIMIWFRVQSRIQNQITRNWSLRRNISDLARSRPEIIRRN